MIFFFFPKKEKKEPTKIGYALADQGIALNFGTTECEKWKEVSISEYKRWEPENINVSYDINWAMNCQWHRGALWVLESN